MQIGVRYNDKKVKFLHLVSMRRHYPKNLSKSLIIRDYIREMKIRMAFYHFLRAFSLILLPKIKKKIIVSFHKFLIYRKKKKKKKRNYSFSKKNNKFLF